MEFAKSFNLFGVEGKEIPCITGKGAPTKTTKGAVGCLYMDENTGHIYKCTAAGSEYTWTSDTKTLEELGVSVSELENAVAVEQARINELVALRGTNGELEYPYDDSVLEYYVRSNGVYATISGRFYGATLAANAVVKFDLPEQYWPFVNDVTLYEDSDVIFALACEDRDDLPCSLMLINKYNDELLAAEFYFTGEYALRDVVISEVADIRVGHDGVTYPRASDAVRSQVSNVAADVSVLQENLLKKVVSKNLYNPDTGLTTGVLAEDGTVYAPGWGDYSTSDYIVVDPSKDIILTSENSTGTARVFVYVQSIVFYDSEKAVISRIFDAGNRVFTTPDNCRYVRISVRNTVVSRNLMLEYASEVVSDLSHYEPYGETIVVDIQQLNDVSEELSNVRIGYDGKEYATAGDAVRTQIANVAADVAVLNDNLLTTVTSRNLYDANKALTVGIIDSDGVFHTAGWDAFSTTDYIEVEPDKDIVFTAENAEKTARNFIYVQSIVFFNGDKKIIYGEYDAGNKVFTTPGSCRYVRISAYANWFTSRKAMLEYSSSVDSNVAHYEPHYDPYVEVDVTGLHGIGSGGDVNGLPTLYLSGDATLMTKDDYVTLDYSFQGRKGTCDVKWQGSSSLTYPEKNYTIKFDTAFEAVTGWGAEKKYCAKANYIDFSQARNVCAAKLWGQIVKSRSGTDSITTSLKTLPNGGAIDGFPIIIVLNEEFLGVYTFNIPKEGWMFGMGDGAAEYILCAENWGDPERFKATIADASNIEDSFVVEYAPDGTDNATITASLNNLIQATINAVDDSTALATIDNLLDWQSAIDYYIFACLIRGDDITAKNYLLATYDGVKWFFSAYDLDSIFGLYWDGKKLLPASGGTTFASYADIHNLMYLIKKHKASELKSRYESLRNSALSEDNVVTTFSNFIGLIPANVYEADRKKWHTKPSTSVNNISQIADWYRRRVVAMDREISKM